MPDFDYFLIDNMLIKVYIFAACKSIQRDKPLNEV